MEPNWPLVICLQGYFFEVYSGFNKTVEIIISYEETRCKVDDYFNQYILKL